MLFKWCNKFRVVFEKKLRMDINPERETTFNKIFLRVFFIYAHLNIYRVTYRDD